MEMNIRLSISFWIFWPLNIFKLNAQFMYLFFFIWTESAPLNYSREANFSVFNQDENIRKEQNRY